MTLIYYLGVGSYSMTVIGGQFGFGSAFTLAYLVSPKFCHRFVGYVEEEACSTYTKIIKAIETAEEGNGLARWRKESAPAIARSYWKLGENGTVLDLMYAVRADEAEHRDVNHLCSSMKDGMKNPLINTEEKLNTMLLKYVSDLMERDATAKLRSV
jgi:demethoxyubiquinone hydroxylase (CLK1/Coq7/Cat5 family)